MSDRSGVDIPVVWDQSDPQSETQLLRLVLRRQSRSNKLELLSLAARLSLRGSRFLSILRLESRLSFRDPLAEDSTWH
jgi:hypothetical protein